MCVVRSVFGHLSGETGVSGSYDFDPPPNTLSELPLGEHGGIHFTTTTSGSHLGASRDRNDWLTSMTAMTAMTSSRESL